MTQGNSGTHRQDGDRVAAVIAARQAATRTSFARGTHAGQASFDDLVRVGMRAALRFGVGRPRGQAEPLPLPAAR